MKNLVGFIPELNDEGIVSSPQTSASSRPVVVYISRQGGGRRLPAEDHELLVGSLLQLEAEGMCEVHVVAMERMGLRAQVEVVSRATVSTIPPVPIISILIVCVANLGGSRRSRKRTDCKSFLKWAG